MISDAVITVLHWAGQYWFVWAGEMTDVTEVCMVLPGQLMTRRPALRARSEVTLTQGRGRKLASTRGKAETCAVQGRIVQCKCTQTSANRRLVFLINLTGTALSKLRINAL